MEAFEIMISESQERMAAIVTPDAGGRGRGALRHWDIDATVIGEVTDRGKLRCFLHGAEVGDIPVSTLVEDCPRYVLTPERPARLRDEPIDPPPPSSRPTADLRALLGSPNIASRRWITRQYDQLVGSGTVIRPGGDAGVVRLTPSNRAIAISLDGNGRRTWLDPRRGGASAVCEAARNVACTGARPAAVTNCLNFGNPETPEVAYELRRGHRGHVAGLRGARPAGGLRQRLALQRAHEQADLPDARGRRGRAARGRLAGGLCRLQGRGRPGVPGGRRRRPRSTDPSTRRWCSGRSRAASPIPTSRTRRGCTSSWQAPPRRGCCASAHDVSDGGLAVCVAESAIAGGIGVTVEAEELFAEGEGRVVISVSPELARGAPRHRRRPADPAARHRWWRPDPHRSGTLELARRNRDSRFGNSPRDGRH